MFDPIDVMFPKCGHFVIAKEVKKPAILFQIL